MSSCALTTQERAARKQEAAIAELKRNGIEVAMPKEPAAPVEVRRPAGAIDLPGIALNVRATTGRRDFVSRPDAKAMQPGDIANIARLTRADAREILRAIRAVAPEVVDSVCLSIDDTWGDWPEDDERWGLTPHEARKFKRRKAV